LLMSLGEETRRENASSCDPDKRIMQRQENTVHSARAVFALFKRAFLNSASQT
jgi:hypothetical protein